MCSYTTFLIGYTIINGKDELRNEFQKMIIEEYHAENINQSMFKFSTGIDVASLKAELIRICQMAENKSKQKFDSEQNEFVKLYYSAALVDIKGCNRDKIVEYSVI